MKIKPGHIEFEWKKTKMTVNDLESTQGKLTRPIRNGGDWKAEVTTTNHLGFPLPKNAFLSLFLRFDAVLCLAADFLLLVRVLLYIPG